MNHGVIEQEGTPDQVVDAPATLFVASFLATGNVCGRIDGNADGAVRVELGGGRLEQLDVQPGDRVYVRRRKVKPVPN